jgi:hypothetical protein
MLEVRKAVMAEAKGREADETEKARPALHFRDALLRAFRGDEEVRQAILQLIGEALERRSGGSLRTLIEGQVRELVRPETLRKP